MGQAVTWLLARWEQRGCGVATALVLAAVWGAAGAQPVAPAGAASAAGEGAAPASPVYTRARLVSVEADAGGNTTHVRLKLLPRAKLPFTTQTFRVANPALLHGISQGSWVQFTARHIDGENTLTSIRVTAECKRLEPCD